MALTKTQLSRLPLVKLKPLLIEDLLACKREAEELRKSEKHLKTIRKMLAFYKKEYKKNEIMREVLRKLYSVKKPKPTERNRRYNIDLWLTNRMLAIIKMQLGIPIFK